MRCLSPVRGLLHFIFTPSFGVNTNTNVPSLLGRAVRWPNGIWSLWGMCNGVHWRNSPKWSLHSWQYGPIDKPPETLTESVVMREEVVTFLFFICRHVKAAVGDYQSLLPWTKCLSLTVCHVFKAASSLNQGPALLFYQFFFLTILQTSELQTNNWALHIIEENKPVSRSNPLFFFTEN